MSYARDHLIPLIDEGLGNSAYLADLGGGRALAVDASRDLRALRQAASRRGLRVAFAADTHLHADFHVELGDLPARTQDAPAGAVVMCGHGERAMTAASLLQRAGHHGLAVLVGGAGDWADATGQPLRVGP